MRFCVRYNVIRPWSDYGLPPTEPFLPQSFKAAGYQTAANGKWHFGHSQVRYAPNSRGFEHSYCHQDGAIEFSTHERDGGLDWPGNGKSVRKVGYSTDLLAAEAVRCIRSRDRNRPFFLYTAFNVPHCPLQALQCLIDKYAGIPDLKRRTVSVPAQNPGRMGRNKSAPERRRAHRDGDAIAGSGGPRPQEVGAR